MAATPSRLARIRGSLTPREWSRVGGMVGFIIGLYVVGWGVFILAILPQHSKFLGIGVAVTAYTLGLRHAFDADHISAIDNTTRKLMSEGKRPLSVGFWFSLGHSSRRVRAGNRTDVRGEGDHRPDQRRQLDGRDVRRHHRHRRCRAHSST